MLSVRFRLLLLVACCGAVAKANKAKQEDPLLDKDYIDDIKDYVAHNAEEAGAKYTAQINKIDMIDDYPHDDDFHDHHDHDDDDDDDDDEDYDEEDYDDDDDDDDEGGCGGGGDDEDDEDLNPVQEVIDEYFTR